jgi:putative flippase GtrA
LRSALAGGTATLVDLASLATAVGVLGVAPRVASVPALLAGALVQFLGNRYFAFRAASRGTLPRQAALFAATEATALLLNAALFDLVARRVALDAGSALVARALTTNLVYLAFSYPMFRRIFAARPASPGA